MLEPERRRRAYGGRGKGDTEPHGKAGTGEDSWVGQGMGCRECTLGMRQGTSVFACGCILIG